MRRIYLDNNAAASMDPRVKELLLEEYSRGPANASSIHYFGQEAKKRLIGARQTIAELLQISSKQILFTSGGTEANNALVHHFTARKCGGHIITTAIEHPSLFEPIAALRKRGFEITVLEVGASGAPSPESISKAIRRETILLAFSGANSETGVKLDLEAVASLAEERKIPLIIDGIGLLGRDHFSIPSGVAGMSFSSHKIHGPQGVGCLYLKNPFFLENFIHGGGQESGYRSGTENLPGIMGFAKALEILKENETESIQSMRKLRDQLETSLMPYGIKVNGTGARVSNTSNLFFPLVDGESLLIHLDLQGICASHGSACSTGSLEPSKVLLGMGYSHAHARNSLRFSLSRNSSALEIEQAVGALKLLFEQISFPHKKVLL